MTPDPYRLPRSVAPRHYHLELTPDLGAATFAGRARIDLDIREVTDTLVLNAIELSIASCTVDGQSATFSLD
ncbi:MAG: hypothetical protein F2795_05360, partial [Actinobacteria bacterium]|nr:hypothetical protein [Actinomycetota bacterium]